MKILLTASFNKGLFCNGLNQNIITLAELIKNIGLEPIIAINHEMDKCQDPPVGILIVERNEIDEYGPYDYVLQTGWVIDNPQIDRIKEKNPRCKNVHIHYGNRLLADIEQSSWDNRCIPPYRTDEVWYSPHYEFSRQYFQTYYKTEKVLTLPYIWSDKYVKNAEKELNKENKTCFYKPGQNNNIAILEPNLNMTKHCLPSIFICEEFFNQYPEHINHVNVFCSSKVVNANYFKSILWNLEITNKGKISFAGRLRVWDTFQKGCNIVVSHQLMNALNYTYLEALYFNIPLIHNSEYIQDVGYYYQDYNIKDGSKSLFNAVSQHDNNLEEYQKKAKNVINRYSPENEQVIKQYKKLFS